MIRVDGCLVPPGFIASAKMYSLVLDGDTLYAIFTGPGPASIIDYSRAALDLRQRKGVLEDLAVSTLLKSYLTRIREGERRIDGGSLAELAAVAPGMAFPKAAVSECRLEVKDAYAKLSFKAEGKKRSFECVVFDLDSLKALAAALGAP